MLYTDLSPTVHTFYQFSASVEDILREKKKTLLCFEYVGTAVVCYRILVMRQQFRLVFMYVTVLCTGGCPIWKN